MLNKLIIILSKRELFFLTVSFQNSFKSVRSLGMVRTLLVCGAVVRLLLTLAHYQMVARFVRSKPPGRKMVSRQ